VIHAHDHDNDFYGVLDKNNKSINKLNNKLVIMFNRNLGYNSSSISIKKRGSRILLFTLNNYDEI